ncbi:MAG TPA: ABC transporter permease [Thermomicrobiales bacterium]|nr:ABC transporter permease [Thermomicrobiales bacterium]
MKRLLTLVRMDARQVVRNRQALGWTVLYPLALLLFMGYVGRNGTAQATFGSAATVTYTGFLMVGMIVLAALTEGIMGHSQGMVTLRAQGILRRVRCTPLPTWLLLVSRTVVEAGVILASTLLLVAVGVAFYGVRLATATLPAALGLLLLSSALFVALGQAIAALVRTAETARAAALGLALPLMFLAGIFIQPDIFPPTLQAIARWTPGAVAADLLRPALLQGNFGAQPWLTLLALVGYLVAALALSARFFRWDEAA